MLIGILEGKILTGHLRAAIPPRAATRRPTPPATCCALLGIAVIESHGRNGNIATGFVKGFGTRAEAIASTVCHEHHDIVAVGAYHADMALAANRLAEIEGGFGGARGGALLAELPLPVAGLMSLKPFETVRGWLIALRAAARSLGVRPEEPFLQRVVLALPVIPALMIPALTITDRGMVDVVRFEITADGEG